MSTNRKTRSGRATTSKFAGPADAQAPKTKDTAKPPQKPNSKGKKVPPPRPKQQAGPGLQEDITRLLKQVREATELLEKQGQTVQLNTSQETIEMSDGQLTPTAIEEEGTLDSPGRGAQGHRSRRELSGNIPLPSGRNKNTARKRARSEDLSDAGSDTESHLSGKDNLPRSNRRNDKRSVSSQKRSHSGNGYESDMDYQGYDSDGEFGSTRTNFGLLVGQNVPESLKTRIKEGKFVEFSDLLPSNFNKQKHFVLKETKEQGVHFVNHKSAKYLNIQQWNEAFASYMSIFMETGSNMREVLLLGKQLLTYQKDVNALAQKNQNWAVYDRNYRRDRASQHNPPPFSDIRHDLLIDVTLFQSRNVKDGFRQGQKDNFRQKFRRQNGTCYAYNDASRRCERPRCNFRHACQKCGRDGHPSYRCQPGHQQQTGAGTNSQPARTQQTAQQSGGARTQTAPTPRPGLPRTG